MSKLSTIKGTELSDYFATESVKNSRELGKQIAALVQILQNKSQSNTENLLEIKHEKTWQTSDSSSRSRFKSSSYSVYQHTPYDLTIIAVYVEPVSDYTNTDYTWLAEKDNISSYIEAYWQDQLFNLKSLVKEALKQNHQIIFTGHSLGGFLAQMLVANLLLQSSTEEHSSIKAIVFDSPGIKAQAEHLFSFFTETRTDFHDLDSFKEVLQENIVCFNNIFNKINLLNSHLGSTYLIESPLVGRDNLANADKKISGHELRYFTTYFTDKKITPPLLLREWGNAQGKTMLDVVIPSNIKKKISDIIKDIRQRKTNQDSSLGSVIFSSSSDEELHKSSSNNSVITELESDLSSELILNFDEFSMHIREIFEAFKIYRQDLVKATSDNLELEIRDFNNQHLEEENRRKHKLEKNLKGLENKFETEIKRISPENSDSLLQKATQKAQDEVKKLFNEFQRNLENLSFTFQLQADEERNNILKYLMTLKEDKEIETDIKKAKRQSKQDNTREERIQQEKKEIGEICEQFKLEIEAKLKSFNEQRQNIAKFRENCENKIRNFLSFKEKIQSSQETLKVLLQRVSTSIIDESIKEEYIARIDANLSSCQSNQQQVEQNIRDLQAFLDSKEDKDFFVPESFTQYAESLENSFLQIMEATKSIQEDLSISQMEYEEKQKQKSAEQARIIQEQLRQEQLRQEQLRQEQLRQEHMKIISIITSSQEEGASIAQVKLKLHKYASTLSAEIKTLLIQSIENKNTEDLDKTFQNNLQALGYQDRSGTFHSLVDWLIKILHLPFKHIPSECSKIIVEHCKDVQKIFNAMLPCIKVNENIINR